MGEAPATGDPLPNDRILIGEYPPASHRSAMTPSGVPLTRQDVLASHEFIPDPHELLELHFKFNGTDGVSLVSETFDQALQTQGFRVHKCASDIVPGQKGLRLEELSYQSAQAKALTERVFTRDEVPQDLQAQQETALLEEINSRAQVIQEALTSYIKQHNIGVVSIRNICSLPLNLPATVALTNIMADEHYRQVKFVLFHHDFYWEPIRSDKYISPYPKVSELIRTKFPPLDPQPNVTHIVLNNIVQRELQRKTGIQAHVLPDPYDYQNMRSAKEGVHDGEPLREKLGLNNSDLLVMIPTRIVPRKAIEFAIPIIAELKRRTQDLIRESSAHEGLGPHKRRFDASSRIVLVLPQGEDMNDHAPYADALRTYAKNEGVEIIFAGEYIRPPGDHNGGPGNTRLPFYKVYKEADIAVFPSVYEGFGNQLHEIVDAGLVPVMYEYKVFRLDIHLPHYISLGHSFDTLPPADGVTLKKLSHEINERAASEIIEMLTHPEKWKKKAEENRIALQATYDAPLIADRFIKEVLG